MEREINHMKKIFCIGDIHGSYKGLIQCLERANFNYQKDRLICLGDVADGWTETYECVEELMKIKDLIYVRGNHDCLSTDTECLTQEGWKKYNKLKKSDLIFSLDVKTGLGKWDKIKKIIIKKTDNINIIENQHISLACTDTHRILTEKRVRIKGKHKWLDHSYITMDELSGRCRFPVSARQDDHKGISLTDFELKVSAWIFTDGGIYRRKDNHTGSYRIYQSNKIEHLKKMLAVGGYKYLLSSRERNTTEICGRKLLKKPKKEYVFAFLSESNKKIKKYLPKKYPFPSHFLKMSSRQFDIFLKEILLADGVTYTKGGRNKCHVLYGTKEFLSNIQALCVSNGYRAMLKKDNRDDYRLNISEYKTTQIDIFRKNIVREKKEQTVWCLSVPMTNFMVRRNGRAFFTGNCWLKDWLKEGKQPDVWTLQGGQNTLKSYMKHNPSDWKRHLDFFKATNFYYVDDKDRCFVHGGISQEAKPIEECDKMFLCWDRELWDKRHTIIDILPFKEVFVGHTSVYRFSHFPIEYNNVWFMDTGSGWEGKTSIMNIDTHKFWQSDICSGLYPDVLGR